MSDQSEVVDLIVRWEDARKQGRELTPEELCRDCPELIPEFKRSLAKGLSALHSTEEHLADAIESLLATRPRLSVAEAVR